MTDRERWTVYPLLFLALGITVKDKLVKIVNVDHVRCNSLVVTDRSGKERVTVASNPAGGIVQLQGDHDVRSVLLGYYNNVAGLMYLDAHGNLRPMIAVPTIAPHKPHTNSHGEPQGDAASDKPSEPAQQPEQTPQSKQPPDEAK
jgi:hypothetical protein